MLEPIYVHIHHLLWLLHILTQNSGPSDRPFRRTCSMVLHRWRVSKTLIYATMHALPTYIPQNNSSSVAYQSPTKQISMSRTFLLHVCQTISFLIIKRESKGDSRGIWFTRSDLHFMNLTRMHKRTDISKLGKRWHYMVLLVLDDTIN